ncbi:MAG TPA: aspartate aminotransferase family protein [Ramlibacter sp.]|nr:aspartate aminotransferase family protein [Ramlibacter sp.]
MAGAAEGRVLHRTSLADPPIAVAGEGCHLIDAAGRRYLDASGGAAVSCLGHGHPAVVEAIQRQAAKLAYAHTSFFSNEPMEELASFLVQRAPPGLAKVYVVSGGSEGVEAALKLARQYVIEAGQPQRTRFVARSQSYHGNTLGALAVGGNEARKKPFAPLLIDVPRIGPCYEYRGRQPGETPEQYGRRAADELEAKLLELGPQTVIGFVAETVVGATAGAVPPAPGYFKRIREICDRHGVLLILDEVMSGMGRTGTLFACEQDGVAPDLVVVAKGLGGGYQPIGAVLASERIVDAVRSGSGAFQHGHTYIGHPIACAAALAVQKTVEREELLPQVRARGEVLRARLADAFRDHPHVGDIRGRGLFLGLELVADRGTKAPFDPARRLHAAVKREAMARGLLVYPSGGTVDGVRGDHVLVAPPFIVAPDEIDFIAQRLRQAVDAATGLA